MKSKKIGEREKVYIVLVNYCNPQITVECITSMQKAGIQLSNIIVVDNNSPDNSLGVLKNIQGIVIIASESNGGFSYGNNLGIKYAMEQDCSCVILLNNDTVVAENFFDEILKGDGKSVNVPKIYYYSNPDVLWYAGGAIDYKRGRQIHYGENKVDDEEFSYEKDIDYATGCCMMIPCSVLNQIGLLDENYFMYWEDMDYSLRLKKAGVNIRYLPEAKVWHKVGMSGGSQSKMAIYYSNRNRFYLMKKYRFGLYAWIYTGITRIIKCVHGMIRKTNDKIIIRAWRDYRKGIMGKVDI